MAFDWRQRWNLDELQHSREIPRESEMPGPAWTGDTSRSDVIGAAFDVSDRERADMHLLMVVAFLLHRERGQLCWADAFGKAREEIAWYAFAKDASSPPVKAGTKLDGSTRYVECQAWREFAKRFYGAEWRLPPRRDDRDEVTQRMNRVGARMRQRGSGKPQMRAVVQGGLF